MNSYDTFHRKQLRQVLRIFHPNHIGNEAVYEQTGSTPISMLCQKMRMKLLGHTLRGNKLSPAYLIMKFTITNPRRYEKRLRAPISMCSIIKDDLKSVDLQLTVEKDLNDLGTIGKAVWQKIVKAVLIAKRMKDKDLNLGVTEKERKLLQDVKDLVEKTRRFQIQQSDNEVVEEREENEEGKDEGEDMDW